LIIATRRVLGTIIYSHSKKQSRCSLPQVHESLSNNGYVINAPVFTYSYTLHAS